MYQRRAQVVPQGHMYNVVSLYVLYTEWVPESQSPTRYVKWLQNLTMRLRFYLPPPISELDRAQLPLRVDIYF